jgi:hypothetical protein
VGANTGDERAGIRATCRAVNARSEFVDHLSFSCHPEKLRSRML